jgi:hypothetical protein
LLNVKLVGASRNQKVNHHVFKYHMERHKILTLVVASTH